MRNATRLLRFVCAIPLAAGVPRTAFSQDWRQDQLPSVLREDEFAQGARFGYPVLDLFSAPGRALGPERGGMVYREELLPVPADPGNMLMPDVDAPPTLGFGFGLRDPGAPALALGAEERPKPVILLRTAVFANVDVAYDTGFQGDISPSTIALPGTADARQSGVFSMSQSSAQLVSDKPPPRCPANQKPHNVG